MVEIIPGIIEHNWPAIREKLEKLEGITKEVHLDVSDGYLTPNKTWRNAADLASVSGFKIELHLMITRPWENIEEWLSLAVGAVVVHYEAFKKDSPTKEVIEIFFRKLKSSGKKSILAFSIDTPWEKGEEMIQLVDEVMLMAITPGYSGQTFETAVLKKIESFHKSYPNHTIEVDGGVRPEVIGDLIRAGASRFVSTSYLWKEKGPGEAIEKYKQAINRG